MKQQHECDNDDAIIVDGNNSNDLAFSGLIGVGHGMRQYKTVVMVRGGCDQSKAKWWFFFVLFFLGGGSKGRMDEGGKIRVVRMIK